MTLRFANHIENLKGQLTISRVQSSKAEDWIEISFRDKDAGCDFATFRVSLENFARAVTAQGYVEGLIEVRGLDIVGTVGENKCETIPGVHPFGDKNKLHNLRLAVKKFEVDGWKARMSDLENPHNYCFGGVRVVFFRNVPKKAEE